MTTRQKTRCKTIEQLAEYEGVSRQTIHKWLKQGAPRKRAGFYSRIAFHEWVLKYKPGESQGNNTLSGVTLQLKQEELLQKRMTREQLQGKLIDADEVRKQGFAAAKQITSTLLRIPPQLGSILGVEAQRRSQVVVEEALNVLKENPLGEVKA